MIKAIQYFTPEYLERCKQMTPLQILQFLEEFRLLIGSQKKKPRNLVKK